MQKQKGNLILLCVTKVNETLNLYIEILSMVSMFLVLCQIGFIENILLLRACSF